jgi:hypothetical protein
VGADNTPRVRPKTFHWPRTGNSEWRGQVHGKGDSGSGPIEDKAREEAMRLGAKAEGGGQGESRA